MKPRPETGLHGLTHCHELFRRRWVNGHGVVEVFGGAHFQCDREALQHFIHTKANAVNTDNLLARSNAPASCGTAGG